MAIKVGGDTVIYDDKVFQVGSGTTAERPASPVNGMLRYNTENQEFEGYVDSEWGAVGGAGSEDSSGRILLVKNASGTIVWGN